MKNSIIIILLLALQPVSAETTDNHEQAETLLTSVRQDLVALQAQFTQYELTIDGRKVDENSGSVWMQSPDLFRWHYKMPYEQLIVADGKQVWVYDEDLQQVTVKNQENNLNPIYVLINKELSDLHYNITYEHQEAGVDWVSLTPKEESNEVKNVWLGLAGSELKMIKVNNRLDQTMVFEFSDIVRNPKLADDLFSFVPPEGVDVVQAIQ